MMLCADENVSYYGGVSSLTWPRGNSSRGILLTSQGPEKPYRFKRMFSCAISFFEWTK
jgi:hypothetical protein